MKILGLIPARGGSKGIPRKNIKLLGDRPLIAYTIQTGLACKLLDTLIVSSEDEEIIGVSKNAGAVVPFIRPVELASDTAPTIDTVLHALHYFKSINQSFDAVCLLQATTPFRHLADLEAAIQAFISSDADSLISVKRVPHQFNPHWIFKEIADTGFLKIATGEKEIISRRQDLPSAYYRDGAIYLTKTSIILEKKSLYGDKIIHHLMTNSPDINIDTMEDWKMAEQYLEQNKNQFG